MKLGLLALGVLVLGGMLSLQKKSGGTGPESETQNQNIELEENGIQGTDAEEAEEPENTEPEPLPYTGQIRVLLKTDGIAETLQEKVRLASVLGSEVTLTDRETVE